MHVGSPVGSMGGGTDVFTYTVLLGSKGAPGMCVTQAPGLYSRNDHELARNYWSESAPWDIYDNTLIQTFPLARSNVGPQPACMCGVHLPERYPAATKCLWTVWLQTYGVKFACMISSTLILDTGRNTISLHMIRRMAWSFDVLIFNSMTT